MKNKDTLPEAIIVYIEKYIGPQFFIELDKKNWIPIASISQYSKVANATRRQFCMRLGYSITTHKTQGLNKFKIFGFKKNKFKSNDYLR